jgi:hypothetical protein
MHLGEHGSEGAARKFFCFIAGLGIVGRFNQFEPG